MKKILIILTALLAHALAGDEAKQADPFIRSVPIPKLPWLDSTVSKIDLGSNSSVNDAIKQIIAGLPPEGRRAIVVEIPEAKLASMRLKSELTLRDVPLGVALRYLEQLSPVGCRLWNNAWYISTKRQDDIIAAEYKISKEFLEQIGIVVGSNQTVTTKKGKWWPPESYWSATYSPLEPVTKEKRETDGLWRSTEMGVLRVLAARSFQEEISAVLLLKARGYNDLSLER